MSEVVGRDELLEVPEIARYLRVSDVTIYRWCRDGRLPCLKLGNTWRVRRSALDDFLAQGEHSRTLMGQLRSFYRMPDNVLAFAQTPEMLFRLDATFLSIGEARGGRLVKFCDPRTGATEDALRAELGNAGLDVERLEGEGRFHLVPVSDDDRMELLRRSYEAATEEGRSLWAVFDWMTGIGVEDALEWQKQMTRFVAGRQVVVQTGILEEDTDEWSLPLARRTQAVHTGTAWLSRAGLSTIRATPVTWG